LCLLTSKHKYKRTSNASKLSTDIRGMQLVQIEFHARYSVYLLYSICTYTFCTDLSTEIEMARMSVLSLQLIEFHARYSVYVQIECS
jgi:hypothetical protein